jgi:hypothetical protein
VHPPSTWRRFIERLRGYEQRLVRPGAGYPLFLLSYPRGQEEAVAEVEAILGHRLPHLPRRILEPYADTLANLPAMVVVILRPRNPCRCLGHFHPAGTESRLARRLSSELGSYVGELDLAHESIRNWEPHPISALAAGDLGVPLTDLHFEAALLAVFLHELQHVAFPNREERDIRSASNTFYMDLMQELVSREGGATYGMNAKSSA